MKRSILTMKQFDYTSKEAFEKDIPKMKEKGYQLIHEGMFYGKFEPSEINDGSDKWKFTACFVKDTF